MNPTQTAQMNIERAVLSSYIYFDEFCAKGEKNPATIDPSFFTIPFHKRLMQRINETIESGGKISITCFQIQEKIRHSNSELAWLDILRANPLPMETVKHYVEWLHIAKIKREME